MFLYVFGVQHQVWHTKNIIKKDFKHLHQLLYDEEKAMLAALYKEKTQKTQLIKDKIEKMNDEILSLSKMIRELRGNLDSGDIQFLQVRPLLFLLYLYCLLPSLLSHCMHLKGTAGQ